MRAIESGVDVRALKTTMNEELAVYASPDPLPIIWP